MSGVDEDKGIEQDIQLWTRDTLAAFAVEATEKCLKKYQWEFAGNFNWVIDELRSRANIYIAKYIDHAMRSPNPRAYILRVVMSGIAEQLRSWRRDKGRRSGLSLSDTGADSTTTELIESYMVDEFPRPETIAMFREEMELRTVTGRVGRGNPLTTEEYDVLRRIVGERIGASNREIAIAVNRETGRKFHRNRIGSIRKRLAI